MRNCALVALALAAVLPSAGCREQAPPSFTEAQQASARLEVEQVFNAFLTACERLDLDAVLGLITDSPGFRFIDIEGHVYDGPGTRTSWARSFEAFEAATYATTKMEITPQAPDRTLVLWQGAADCTQKDGSVLRFESVGWTILFQRLNGARKIVHFHESAPPPKPLEARPAEDLPK